MVPIQTTEMQSGDPLRVCVESYNCLPVDLTGFVGAPPEICGMIPYSPFDFYIKLKLYVHNMGHACCAYLGMYNKYDYIHEAINDPDIRLICQGAMIESATALAAQYGESVDSLTDHAFDLIERFGNRALMDTCSRVGHDIPRKLTSTDRLIGAAHNCLSQNIIPMYIVVGCAAAVFTFINQSNMEQTFKNAQIVLSDYAELTPEHPLAGKILLKYDMLAEGAHIAEIKNFIIKTSERNLSTIRI
jgi:mannitol-1-phosphate 5-dehydrogenase